MERIKKIKNNSGFALLYAIVISSIIFSISLSVSNIALKEIMFSTSAKDANDAFYATDTATECALFYDSFDPSKNAFTGTLNSGLTCGGNTIVVNKPTSALVWNFIASRLGGSGKACAQVTVDKEDVSITKITSVGYNNGGTISGFCTPSINTTQRVIELSY